MEGAEGVRSPRELEEWWARGVRLIGLAWAGNRYCGGTGEPGPLTSEGYALLEAMAAWGLASTSATWMSNPPCRRWMPILARYLPRMPMQPGC